MLLSYPGVQDTAEAKRILGKTANLEFRLAAPYGATTGTYQMFSFKSHADRTVDLLRDIIITGNQVTNAQFSYNTQNGQPLVNITLDSRGGQRMLRITQENLGRQMAVLYIEQKPIVDTVITRVDGKEERKSSTRFKK